MLIPVMRRAQDSHLIVQTMLYVMHYGNRHRVIQVKP